MEVFLNRAFDKLKKDGRAKQYAAVRDACDKARDALRDDRLWCRPLELQVCERGTRSSGFSDRVCTHQSILLL